MFMSLSANLHIFVQHLHHVICVSVVANKCVCVFAYINHYTLFYTDFFSIFKIDT